MFRIREDYFLQEQAKERKGTGSPFILQNCDGRKDFKPTMSMEPDELLAHRSGGHLAKGIKKKSQELFSWKIVSL